MESDLYGYIKVEEPVLKELINSKLIQRLKGISQMGLPAKWYHNYECSRFQHSVGVMFLLKKLNASLEEQVAGLLHDISHTAFSHVIDWVFGNTTNEDYQDKNHLKILSSDKEISDILKKYGYDIKNVAELKNFTLLEKEIPDVCIDRIDYLFRDMLFNREKFPFLLNSLRNYTNRVVFSCYDAAKDFGKEYIKCQNEHWSSIDVVLRYLALSSALNTALGEKIITKKDLMENEDYLIEKLENSNNKKIKDILEYLLDDELAYTCGNLELPQKKFRYVDPDYLEDGKLKRLSKEDRDYKKLIEESRKKNEKRAYVTLPIEF